MKEFFSFKNNKDFFKMLLTICVPIVMQNLINVSVNLIDSLMVGQLGDISVAAVNSANQVYFALNLIMFGVSSGVAVFMAQYWGKKDIEGIHKSIGLGLIILLPIMTIATVSCIAFPEEIIRFFTLDESVISIGSEYLFIVSFSFIPSAIILLLNYAIRSTENVKLPLATTLIALSINIILNYLLIFGIGPFPEMGVVGAAIGTLVARYLQITILIIVIYARKLPVAFNVKTAFSVTKDFYVKFVKTSGFVFLNDALYGIGSVFFFKIYGRMTVQIFAAAGIAKTIENFIWIFFWSFTAAASVSIGKLIGSEDYKKAQQYAYKILIVGFVAGIILAIILLLAINPIMTLYNVSQDVVDTTILYIRIFALFIAVKGIVKIASSGVFRAGGDTKFAFMWEIVPLWLVVLPVAYILVIWIKVPVYVVFIVVIGYDLFRAIPTFVRLKSGKWINNLVK